jgi:hypothetical protein
MPTGAGWLSPGFRGRNDEAIPPIEVPSWDISLAQRPPTGLSIEVKESGGDVFPEKWKALHLQRLPFLYVRTGIRVRLAANRAQISK